MFSMIFVKIVNNLVAHYARNTIVLAVVGIISVWPKLGKAVTKDYVKIQQIYFHIFKILWEARHSC